MEDGARKPLGLVMLDTMIARAEAACEKYRLAAASKRPVSPITLRKREAALQRMEQTLTRLQAQRAAAAAGSTNPRF